MRGPTRGPRRGPTRGPRRGDATAGPAGTIYDQGSAAEAGAFLGELMSTSDLTPMSIAYGWDLVDQFTSNDLWAEGYPVDAAGNAITIASPHSAAGQLLATTDGGVLDYGGGWNQADTSIYAFGAGAWAFLFRARFTAVAAGGDRAFFGRGAAASAHYAGGLDASGVPWLRAKQSGAPTVARLTTPVTTGTWAWFVAGRSVADGALRLYTIGDDGVVAFGAGSDITNAGAAFQFNDTLVAPDGTIGTVAGELDHWLAFDGATAEYILANRAALCAALESME